MTQEQLEEIRAICAAATPGPWRWKVNEHAKQIRLVTDHSGQYYVMGFARYGTQGAQPTFQAYERYEGPVRERGSLGMVKASETSKWKQDYRHDDGWVEHPDAKLIAAAPTIIKELLADNGRQRFEITDKDQEITRLTTRAEALERALKRTCFACINSIQATGTYATCPEPCLGKRWEFDAARFSGTEE